MQHTLFYSKTHFVFQNQEKTDFQMFIIHLNGQNLKTPLLQILVIKMIFSRKFGGIHFFSTFGQKMSLYGQILLPKKLLQVPTCLLRPERYLKTPSVHYFFFQNFRILNLLKFCIWVRFLRYGFFAILKYVKTPKTVKKNVPNKFKHNK